MDKGIVTERKILLAAIRDLQEGRDPPTVVRDPEARPNDTLVARSDVVLPASVDWHNCWETRQSSPSLPSYPDSEIAERRSPFPVRIMRPSFI
ncbi:MAG: hypothetical protein HW416_571 [Chloroflexi bacterium]|nr:hypothetical protein [Chloroflexota bacterium]